MELAFSIVAIILSVFSLVLSLYAVILTKAVQLSTHRIEYLEAPHPAAPDFSKERTQIAEPPKAYDNLPYPRDEGDDFDMDESGI